jgi:phosphomannomutase/phosphoglucomutase
MFFSEGFYGHDDALYAAARLLGILSREESSLEELLSDVPTFVSTPEIRLDCPEEIKFAVVERAVAHFSGKYETVAVDGVRVLFGDGWGLIRASNTQPVLVLRFEASTEERMREIEMEIGDWLRAQGVPA